MAGRLLLAALCGLLLAPAASADDFELLRAEARYVPPLQRSFAATPDGYQQRYDAGRDLTEAVLAAGPASARCAPLRRQLLALARAHVWVAEAADRPVKRRPPPIPRVSAVCTPTSRAPLRLRLADQPLGAVARLGVPAAVRATDHALVRRLDAIGSRFDGWAGLWVHDLGTGRAAGWNADARFPAASTVKLGAIVAALRAAPSLERSRHRHDLRQIGAWSSNLAANRIERELGNAAVADGLRRLGMLSSTYPGAYRATTARFDAPRQPPLLSGRVTTAKDLGRALFRLHAAALGSRTAQRQLGLTRRHAEQGLSVLLAPEREGDNLGLLRPWLGSTLVAEKNGWISSARITAAIVYRSPSPVIVVVEAYRPGLTRAAGRALGRDVLRAVQAK